MMAVELSRGSEVHQTPQVGWAKMLPVMRVTAVNRIPTSSAPARTQSALLEPPMSATRAATNAMVNTNMQFQADGTCTNSIFTTSPMWLSGGV